MPKIAVYNYLTFFIVMFDTMGEPPHLHVTKSKGGYATAAKIWLKSLEFAKNGDLTQAELTLVRKLVEKKPGETAGCLRESQEKRKSESN